MPLDPLHRELAFRQRYQPFTICISSYTQPTYLLVRTIPLYVCVAGEKCCTLVGMW